MNFNAIWIHIIYILIKIIIYLFLGLKKKIEFFLNKWANPFNPLTCGGPGHVGIFLAHK